MHCLCRKVYLPAWSQWRYYRARGVEEKDDRAMRPIYGCPENFRESHGYFSRNYNVLLFRLSLQMCTQNLKFVALSIPEIIGGTRKNWAVPWSYTHAPFSPKFLRAVVRTNPVNVLAKFEIRSFPFLGIIRGTKKIGKSLETPTLPFVQFFSWAFVRMDPVIVLAKFEVRSITRSWDNSDWSFGWGANPNLGEGEAV